MKAIDGLTAAFAGAVIAYSAAKHILGVEGLAPAQQYAYFGLIFSLAINGLVRLKKKDFAHG